MECEFGHIDCTNEGEKCHLCINAMHYSTPKIKKRAQLNKRSMKQDKRQGSSFEYKNHLNNKDVLSGASTRMTPNSGAGQYLKGDEQIQGLVNVMEELKTKVVEQAPGKKSFTIKKEWLDKLNKEANNENMEFWYLKFSFHEYDEDVYVITEKDIIMSMIKTLVEDRKAIKKTEAEKDILEKRRRLIEAENTKLKAEIELLKSQILLKEME